MTSLGRDDGGGPRRGNATMPTWVSRYWWVLLGVGAVLIVIGVVVQENLMTRGGPFVLGVLCALAGLGGALRRHRDPRP